MEEDNNIQESWDSRTRTLIGDEGAVKLASSRILIAGLGGVGGYAAEVLARSGVGALTLIDADTVSTSNLNRQLIAMLDTIGESKPELWRRRLKGINPELQIDARMEYLTADNIPEILTECPTYVVDAIDTVAPKTALITECMERHIPLISSMGAGGRFDPTQVRYGTLADTNGDGLARVLRQRLRKLDYDPAKVEVVWSPEVPGRRSVINLSEPHKRSSYGTLATIPALFGIYMANYIIRKITGL